MKLNLSWPRKSYKSLKKMKIKDLVHSLAGGKVGIMGDTMYKVIVCRI